MTTATSAPSGTSSPRASQRATKDTTTATPTRQRRRCAGGFEIRERLASRVEGLPDDDTLRAHLDSLSGPLIHTLLVSGPWDTANVGGEEVDVDWLFEEPQLEQTAVSSRAPLTAETG